MRTAVIITNRNVRRIILSSLKNHTSINIISSVPDLNSFLCHNKWEDLDLIIIDNVNHTKKQIPENNLLTIMISESVSDTIHNRQNEKFNTVVIDPLDPINKGISLFGDALAHILLTNSGVKKPASVRSEKQKQKISLNSDTISALAIGSSAGGPDAQVILWQKITRPLPVPVFIVQHMPEKTSNFFADKIKRHSQMPVYIAQDGVFAEPGKIYIAPGGKHMTVIKDGSNVMIHTYVGEKFNNCIPSIDILFFSIAEVYKNRTLAVVLTGMGDDGKLGCQQIRDCDGKVLAQDKESSLVWGIPGAVISAGLANAVLPLDEISSNIMDIIGNGKTKL